MENWGSVIPVASIAISLIGVLLVIGGIMMRLFNKTVEKLVDNLKDENRREHDRLEKKIEELSTQLNDVRVDVDKANRFMERHERIIKGTHTRGM